MSNRRKNRKKTRGSRKRILGRALKQTKLAANVTEEQDWYLDTPDVRLTRIFSVVLILHVVAVGGILAFKMIDKASIDSGVQLASAKTIPDVALKQKSTLAAKVPQNQKTTTPAGGTAAKKKPTGKTGTAQVAKTKKATPLTKDPAKKNQYRVLAGDTLAEIAKSLSIDPADLRDVNAIRSDNELYPGRWLDIPSKEKTGVNKVGSSAQPESPAMKVNAEVKTVGNTNSAESTSMQVYEVQSGDTLWGISRKFSLSYQDLISANAIENPQALRIGEKLKIPEKK